MPRTKSATFSMNGSLKQVALRARVTFPTMGRFSRFLPDRASLRNNRWLGWLGPALFQPRLWRLSRRGLALGIALGLFFGLLIPVAQIPLSAGAAVALRANVPAAVVSTLVTNPVTFGPIYYVAWRLGSAILDDGSAPDGKTATASELLAEISERRNPGFEAAIEATIEASHDAEVTGEIEGESWWQRQQRRLLGVGKPLMLGLVVMACVGGSLSYFVVAAMWDLSVWWARRKRRLEGNGPKARIVDRADAASSDPAK